MQKPLFKCIVLKTPIKKNKHKNRGTHPGDHARGNVPVSGARIVGINTGVHQPVESHGRAAGRRHADQDAEQIQQALNRANKQIDKCLNMIAGRLGLDHDRVFFNRFAVPVMVRYLDQRDGTLSEQERDKLMFWFAQAGMWGRFSGSTETYIDQDLAAIAGEDGGLDKLLKLD